MASDMVYVSPSPEQLYPAVCGCLSLSLRLLTLSTISLLSIEPRVQQQATYNLEHALIQLDIDLPMESEASEHRVWLTNIDSLTRCTKVGTEVRWPEVRRVGWT
jgi:hypothetical protein